MNIMYIFEIKYYAWTWIYMCNKVQMFAYGPADATAIPEPHYLFPNLNADWFYLSGISLPSLSWKSGR